MASTWRQWVPFGAVCASYLATTTGESLLAPIAPMAGDDLGFDLDGAGVAFFVLAASIAVNNVVGGVLLRWWRANRVIAAALALTACGGAVSATAQSLPWLLGGQVLIGAGAGCLYPAAMMSIGVYAGERRRGLAIGIFGVAFSGGLALAAGLAAIGARLDWRWGFVFGVVLAVLAACGLGAMRDSPRSADDGSLFGGVGEVLGAPTLVGVVGGVSQYATVAFLPAYALAAWDFTDSRAALLLGVGRVLSIPAKLFAGHLADRRGPIAAARVIGAVLAVCGVIWIASGFDPLAIAGAVLFTAFVSGLFTLANVLAVARVGRRGGALGAFRSMQLGAGALGGLVMGHLAEAASLRATLAVGVVLPVAIVALRRRPVSDT